MRERQVVAIDYFNDRRRRSNIKATVTFVNGNRCVTFTKLRW